MLWATTTITTTTITTEQVLMGLGIIFFNIYGSIFNY